MLLELILFTAQEPSLPVLTTALPSSDTPLGKTLPTLSDTLPYSVREVRGSLTLPQLRVWTRDSGLASQTTAFSGPPGLVKWGPRKLV